MALAVTADSEPSTAPEARLAAEQALRQSPWGNVPEDVLLKCFLLLLNSPEGLRQVHPSLYDESRGLQCHQCCFECFLL